MAVPRLKWRSLIVDGKHSDAIRKATENASGAYAIRTKSGHTVVYVGFSGQGVMWKTLTRHFNAPDTFKAPKPKGGANSFAVRSPGDYEVAWRVTSRGHRTKEKRDKRAEALESRWIAAFSSAGHAMKNQKRPPEDSGDDYRAHLAKQEEEERDAGAFGSLLNPASPPGKRDRFEVLGAMRRLQKTRENVEERRGAFRDLSSPEWTAKLRELDAKRDKLEAEFVTAEARDLDELARQKNPAPYPVVGQVVLVELGLLTRLDLRDGVALEWSLREAPILAYRPDAARAGGGGLVICYRGPVVRSSTRAELREYGKKHWGAAGPGNVRDCGVAVAPWKSLGPSTAITYTTKKGRDGAPIDYVHLWHSNRKETPPRVDEHRCKGGCKPTCAAAGSIRLSGGTYSVEDRGIVG